MSRSGPPDADAVAAVNDELYASVEARDIDRMSAVWDDDDDITCVHPGWPMLRGRARVDWDPRRAARIPGAQRVVDFDLEEAVELADGMPLRWRFGSYHRFNPPLERCLPASASVP